MIRAAAGVPRAACPDAVEARGVPRDSGTFPRATGRAPRAPGDVQQRVGVDPLTLLFRAERSW